MEGASQFVKVVDAHAKFLETLLECIGLWKCAQQVCRIMSHQIALEPSHCGKLKSWIQVHVDLDLTVQRLGKYKWKQLYRPDDNASFTSESSSDSEMFPLGDRIAAYNQCAFTMQLALQSDLDRFPDSAVKRAILSLRRNTQWDNSKWIRSQCTGKGGCCQA
ncbi:hypothetical protein N8T08_007194 [Aspergillus melleus]|uniref:Uncharacterized protein n=1 Tax=Aspergillus melleus TaxID=138277 RepID=A0ACC3AYS5_9EURO|nr:hypothetical protein N8T08_007194 [Aspergillus melleus]